METLLGVPEDTHVAMKASILDLIAELAQWLNKHSQFLGERACQLLEQATVLECVVSLSLVWCTLLSPSLPSPLLSSPLLPILCVSKDKVLAFILSGLRNRAISTHAAWAIQAICEHCRESMVQNLDGLLQVEWVGQDGSGRGRTVVGGAVERRLILRAGLVCCEVLCACCCVLCLLLQIVEAGDSLGITPEAVTGLYKSEGLLNVPHPPGAKCPSPPQVRPVWCV